MFDDAYKAIAEAIDQQPDPTKKAELLRTAKTQWGPFMDGFDLWRGGARGFDLFIATVLVTTRQANGIPE